MKVRLSISCTGLRDADVFSKSDPLVTIFDTFNNELGRTECIDNELNPVFKETITLDYDPLEEQELIFKVWDIDDYNNDITKADFLGETQCTLEQLVDCANFSKPLRYEGADFGKIFVKTEKLAQQQKGGKKAKKGKKVAGKKKIENESSWIKKEDMTATEDTFKSLPLDGDLDETHMTQAFTPGRYTPTREEEEEVKEDSTGEEGLEETTEMQFVSTTDGATLDGFSASQGSGTKTVYDMTMKTPLEDISCISPLTGAQRAAEDDTFNHLTGEYLTKKEDTYDEIAHYRSPPSRSPPCSPLHSPVRAAPDPPHYTPSSGGTVPATPDPGYEQQFCTVVQQQYPTPEERREEASTGHVTTDHVTRQITHQRRQVVSTGTAMTPSRFTPLKNNANLRVTSPPAIPPSIHNIPPATSAELRWCRYSTKDSSVWEDGEQSAQDQTQFYSFTDSNRRQSRRPPIQEDFERCWENVLMDHNSPDWSAVDSQQWRTWFEFYKANAKVKKMRSLLVGTMMGSREAVLRGNYTLPSTGECVYLPGTHNRQTLLDKALLQDPPPPRYSTTEINVINTDPIQVCLHLQRSGYRPGLFVPAHPESPGGGWRTGGIGPLEEFIRRSNYYTCVDDIDGGPKGQKRSGKLGLLGPTEVQMNPEVTVFRESQQRNYMLLPKPQQIDIFSVTPLPKLKKGRDTTTLTKEEAHLLKKKISLLIVSAATHGVDCLVLSPHLTEGRKVPHRQIAQILQGVTQKYSGLVKRVIMAIERDVIFHVLSKEILSVYNKTFPSGWIDLPSPEGMPPSQDIVMWHWMGDNSNWYPYDPKQNEVIDAIYLRGESRMSMKGADSAHPGYLVDFHHFTVKSLSSGASRRIGRFKLVYDRIVKRSSSRPAGNWMSAVESEPSGRHYETAGEESIAVQVQVPVWQWLTDDNVWCDYGSEQSGKLETAYLQHGTACVILTIGNTRFSVNTKSRVQTNTSSGKQRKVQRILRQGSPPCPAAAAAAPATPTQSGASPRATSTPTPPTVRKHCSNNGAVVWEHQLPDLTWQPFHTDTIGVMEGAFGEGKTRVTVVFNNQAYWIYFDPYYVLVDPKINEEFPIRRAIVPEIQPQRLFTTPAAPAQPCKPVVTPMSNSTMIDNTALFTTAPEISESQIQSHEAEERARKVSSDSVRLDANNNRMQKTFMRHPSVQATLQNSVVRDPAREFSWEWCDTRLNLWHSLPEFISCFLEPASKTQTTGGVRTSKLTHGKQRIVVRADFTGNTITGHLPGRPSQSTPLRRVEVCPQFSA